MTRLRQQAAYDAEPHAVREALAREIAELVSASGLTQKEVATQLGTTQPKVSALMAGNVEGFSMDRLVKYLNLLGQDVHIVVLPKPAQRKRAETRVCNPPTDLAKGRPAYA